MRLFSDVASSISDPWLRRAFVLAENGRGTTSPNPLVGCVIVANGEVVGEGFHERAGSPHAEVLALAEAGAAAHGATAYVTLEPCNHHGRTPPCTEALFAAGVSRVVVGMSDPNPLVGGGGAEALCSAGIEVLFAEDPTPFAVQNEAWVAATSRSDAAGPGRPFVRVKVALSLDGRPALVQGRPAAITGVSGAQVTRALRARADAVLVGAATVAADDPALTVRDSDAVLAVRQPLRVVLARAELPPVSARVFTDGAARTLVLAPGALAAEARVSLPHAVEIAEYDPEDGIPSALRTLAEIGVVDLLVETGPHLLTALWEGALVDELITVQAGGMAGLTAPALFLGGPDVPANTADTLARVMSPLEAGVVGDVAVTVWRPSATPHDAPLGAHLGNPHPTQPGR